MGKCTVRTVFYLFSILFDITGIPRAVFPQIHRTVTKHAVKVCQALMTGKILTRSVLKKTVWAFHIIFLWSFPYIVLLFPQKTLQKRDSTGNTNAGIPSSGFHLWSHSNRISLSPVSAQWHPRHCLYCQSNEIRVRGWIYLPAKSSFSRMPFFKR